MATRRQGKGGKIQTTPWQKDPAILKRIEYVADQHSAGRSLADLASELGTTPQTIANDWNRAVQLYGSQTTDAIGEHISNLRAYQRKVAASLDRLPEDRQVVGRAQLLTELRQLELAIAKLDGSEAKAKASEASLGDASVTFSLTIASPEVHVNAIEAPGRPALPEPKLVGSDDILGVEPDTP